MVFSVGIIIAQEKTITGTVSAEGEGPLPGVNVTVQGTTIGIITDASGNYSIRVPGPTSVLVFSSIGYVTQGITVGTQTVINVTLVSDVKALQEVVVTGYTSQRKRDITGSVGVVETSKLTAIPVGNVSAQLQGRTSGVTVTSSGQPGESGKVRIRGFSSFENNDPLYIVDGVPTQDINSLNPNDVESLTVLKDAGAASVYGSRASNGVIVITTKKGSKGGVKVTYDMYIGSQNPGNGPTEDLLNTQEYMDLQALVYKNTGVTETHPVYGPSTNMTLPSWAADTDWYAELTRNAPIMNHDLTFSAGNDNSRFFAGFGYFDQQGIILSSYTKRYSARFNSDFTFLKNRVKIGENFQMSYSPRFGVGNLNEGSPIQQASYRSQSIIPVIWTGPDYVGSTHTFKAGDWGGTGIAPRLGNVGNQIAGLTRSKDNTNWSTRMIGSAYLDVQLLKGVNFRSTIGGTYYFFYGVNWSSATYENAENTGTSSLTEQAGYGSDWNWTNAINIDKQFGDHKINGVIGYEAVKYGIGRDMNATRAGYFSDAVDFRTLSNGATITGANSSFYTPTTLASLFAKADYSLKDKYYLSATIRRDGSSRFGPETRYGVFPSFSAGWRIGDETFLDGAGFISDLKIRGSYGTMGNQLAVSPQNQYYLFGGSTSSTNYDLNGTGTSSLQGFAPTQIGNPDAKWETNISMNIGFDASLFNNKVTFIFDYYTKNTQDLLFPVEKPAVYGAASVPYVNVASMSNKGVDMELGYKNNWGDFGMNLTGTFTSYKNEITEIAPGIEFFDQGGGTTRIGAANRNMVGHPMSSFFGYEVVGLFQDAADVTNSPKQDGAEAGFFKYADVSGDGKIGPEDRTFIGDPNPACTYGLNITFTYKAFDLTAYAYGSQGNDINNWNRWWIDFWPSFQGQKSKALLYESWTPERPNATVPKASNVSNFSTNTQVVSYYIENGSFMKLKNLQFGYTLPQAALNKVGIKSLRLYIQGVNLLTFTKYSGLDPELGGDDRAFGSDTGNYPMVKQFIFGLNLTL
jgi:TonB-linked SusC/RagA family outer membrane protein